jgi:hypothetical protein
MTTTSRARGHPVLAALTGLVAVNAYAGSVALAIGVVDFGATIIERLPFGSPVFAAIALTVIVAVPMTIACWFAARGYPRLPPAAIAAGTLLIGWVVVQIAFIQTVNWLHAVMVVAGLAVLATGLPGRKAMNR